MVEGLEQRIARLEAESAIRMLAVRYAHAVDSRDVDALVALFVDDAAGGNRHAVRSRYEPALRTAYRTIHMVSNHLIDLIGDDLAHGRVYTRAEEERKDSWAVRAMMYFDRYERHDGTWYIANRQTHYWYLTEFDSKPHAPGFMHPLDDRGRKADLPHIFPTWEPFWAEAGSEQVAKVTNER